MGWRSSALGGFLLFLGCGSVWAEHARITLEVTTSQGKAVAHVDQTPPESGKNPRPVVKARAGEPIRLQGVYTNIHPHKTLQNMVVHVFVALEQKVGQSALPDLSGDIELETAVEVDLKPGAKAGQRSLLRIREPGVYLVRIESRNTGSDHEHFAAIDLVVEQNLEQGARARPPSKSTSLESGTFSDWRLTGRVAGHGEFGSSQGAVMGR